MIKSFSDLAANERTYLAWVRTAIALMTFGFLMEKFELFLRVVSSQIRLHTTARDSATIEAVGLMMMSVSVIIMIGATINYLIQRKNILLDDTASAASNVISLALSLFLVVISLFLIGYIVLRVF